MRPERLAALVLTLLALWLGGPLRAEGQGLTVEASPWPLEMPAASALELVSALELRARSGAFGGFSGLEVSADGARIVAITDRGGRLDAALVRREGRIVGLADARFAAISDTHAPAAERDAEGLAAEGPALDGPVWVSFERRHRIGRFNRPAGEEAETAVQPEGWTPAGSNRGLEALAMDPDGRLLAIAEGGGPGGVSPAWWIAADAAPIPATFPGLDGMRPVGADFGPDGTLYVLARRFRPFFGFAFSLWRLTPDGDALPPPDPLGAFVGGTAENAEGLAVWQDAEGRTRLLVVTDDNFSLMQRTLLLEFALRP